MRLFFALFCCLAITPLAAEMIGPVEYHLPKEAKDWKVGNKFESDKSTTIIYIPNEKMDENTLESFGVNTNPFHLNLKDIDALKQSMSMQFPNAEVDLWLVQETPDSIIYEWTIKENKEVSDNKDSKEAKEDKVEKVHGLVRAFSTKDGMVLLAFTTEKIADFKNARASWLAALKEAKIVQ